MTKSYYEAHVTMTGDRDRLRHLTKALSWKFSAIDGDINLGDGVKMYATRQFNARLGDEAVVAELNEIADTLEAGGAAVLRRKVERVIYDDRSSLVKPCDGGCIECHLDDLAVAA